MASTWILGDDKRRKRGKCVGDSTPALHDRGGISGSVASVNLRQLLRDMPPSLTASFLLSVALPRLASAFNVCVLANSLGGYPLCAPGNEMSYNGVDVEAFKYAAGLAGWTYSNTPWGHAAPVINRTWAWECYLGLGAPATVPWMLNASMYSTCAVLIGGIGVNTARLAEGVNYGLYLGNGTAQMVIYDANTVSVDMWSFIRPFSADLWIAFVCTLLAIPPSIWLVEQLTTNGALIFNHITMEDLSQSLYRNILAIFNQDVMFVGSFGGQIVMIAFLFMIMITISTYTANLAAFNTITPPGPTYNSLMDFAGKKILVQTLYAPLISGLYPDLNFTIAPASSSSLWQVETVKTGEYDVVFESTAITTAIIMALNDCNFKIVGKGIDATSLGQVFHSLFPDNIKAEYNTAIIKMSTLGEWGPLATESPSPACTTPSNNPVVTFQQVLGLWIILCGATGFGCLCAGVMVVMRYFRRRRKVAGDDATSATKGSDEVVAKVIVAPASI